VGLGGSGKTRLAIQAAAQSQTFPHGVHFVSLAAISTPEGTIAAVGDALHVPFYVQPGYNLSPDAAQAQLLRYLADKEALLVLDNCEHLVGGPFAELITDLLAAAPRVKLIATSRERLNLPGEWVLEVPGLPVPGGDGGDDIRRYAAVQLFVEGARRAGPFPIAAADWPAIARICQFLDGMPLGVEMASAWTKVLSCQEIADELERDLLTLIATWRTVPERHRTLRTVFDHSWHLLSDEGRNAFSCLSVFRSGFQREAATEVAGASLSLLGTLIDKSFVRRTFERRFEIHPVLRQCAAEKLAADPDAYAEARSRHARYYSEWLGLMYEKLKGGEQLSALAALRVETQNLHDAWGWLIAQRDLDRLHRVLPAMILFHEMRGRPAGAQEVVRLLLDMLPALGHVPGGGPITAASSPVRSSDASLLALVLAALRHFDQVLERAEQTDPLQRASLAIAQDLPDGQEKAFILLLNSMGGGILTSQQSVDLCQQCIDIFGCLGDAWSAALAQLILADAANSGGGVDTELAQRSYQASLEGFSGLRNEWGRALCLTRLANIERRAGHLEQAYRMGRQSLDTYCRMDDAWRASLTRQTLAEMAEGLGRLDEARSHLEANIAYFWRMGDGPRRDDYVERLECLDGRARAAVPDLAHDVRQEETHSRASTCPDLPLLAMRSSSR
jgi:predicted ATPase